MGVRSCKFYLHFCVKSIDKCFDMCYYNITVNLIYIKTEVKPHGSTEKGH